MKNKSGLVHSFKRHIRKRFISGILILIPLGITLFVIRFLYKLTAGAWMPFLRRILNGIPALALIFISVAGFCLMIYLLGLIGSLLIGKKLISLGESFLLKIPLLSTVYSASKRIVSAFSLATESNFKSVVFIDFPQPGVKSMGFITGTVENENQEKCYMVIVPTAPNPTSGFLQIVPCHKVIKTNLSVEEGLKVIVSGGILIPEKVMFIPQDKTAPSINTVTGESVQFKAQSEKISVV